MALRDSFDRILQALHRAALDDAHWPVAAALIEEACGAMITSLAVGEGGLDEEARLHFAGFYRRGERRPDLERAYFDIYDAQDVRVPRLRRLPAGRLTPARDLFTEAELKSSPIWNEALRRVGGQDGVTARLDGPDGLHVLWCTADPVARDGWQSTQLQLIEPLIPHIRHFVLVRQALAAADALGTLTGLLDNSRIGVLHLDRSGRLLAANAPALDILRHGDALTDKGGTLSAWLPADHQRLQHLLARALPRLSGQPPSGGSMNLHRLSHPAPLGLHISPVGDSQADYGGRRVAALVLVVDPVTRPRVDPVRVARALGLTPAEGRVASLLAEGNSVREIAAATGHRLSYVRTLLLRIYRKQDVAGQLPLVRRILALDVLPRR